MNNSDKFITTVKTFIATWGNGSEVETEAEQPDTIESLNTSILSKSKLNVIGENHSTSGQNRTYEKQLCQEIIGGSYWEETNFNIEGQDGDSPLLRIIHLLNQVFHSSSAVVNSKIYIEELSDEDLLAELEGEMDDSNQAEKESSSEKSEEFDEEAEMAKLQAELDGIDNDDEKEHNVEVEETEEEEFDEEAEMAKLQAELDGIDNDDEKEHNVKEEETEEEEFDEEAEMAKLQAELDGIDNKTDE